jgi:hypothetical protein
LKKEDIVEGMDRGRERASVTRLGGLLLQQEREEKMG